MAAVRSPVNDAPRGDVSRYPLELIYDQWRLYGESAEDLLSLLVDGYADLANDHDRQQARVQYAINAQTAVQTLLNAGELFEHGSEEEQQTLLQAPGHHPFVQDWRCAVPLTLVTTFYAPLGALPRPGTSGPGQIWWIDPSTAESLLETLHGVRWIDLHILGPDLVWPARTDTYPNLGIDGSGGYRWRPLRPTTSSPSES